MIFDVNSEKTFGEGNGNPFQWSCLENPRDRGAWWAAVYGVAQSRTRLKRLSSKEDFCLKGSKCSKDSKEIRTSQTQTLMYMELSFMESQPDPQMYKPSMENEKRIFPQIGADMWVFVLV